VPRLAFWSSSPPPFFQLSLPLFFHARNGEGTFSLFCWLIPLPPIFQWRPIPEAQGMEKELIEGEAYISLSSSPFLLHAAVEDNTVMAGGSLLVSLSFSSAGSPFSLLICVPAKHRPRSEGRAGGDSIPVFCRISGCSEVRGRRRTARNPSGFSPLVRTDRLGFPFLYAFPSRKREKCIKYELGASIPLFSSLKTFLLLLPTRK